MAWSRARGGAPGEASDAASVLRWSRSGLRARRRYGLRRRRCSGLRAWVAHRLFGWRAVAGAGACRVDR
jgi:hypothetical protein